MKRLLWGCAVIVVGVIAGGQRAVIAQGTTACDSPCKVTHLPLVGPRGAVCDSPCKLQHLPLVRNDEPVPNSNPLAELQGNIQAANAAYFGYQVDKAATHVLGSGWPQYPDSLKAAKIEGEVVAAFIVDTLGVAEPNSLKILKSTDPLFSAAVRAALPRMRFIPAEKDGVKVRQLVQQPFVFSVVPR